MMRVNAILFDLYDTLAYLDVERYKQLKRTMAEKAGVSPELFLQFWRLYSKLKNQGDILCEEERVSKVLRDLNKLPDRRLIRELAEDEYSFQENEVRLYDDSKSLLYELKKMSLKTGLVTNTGYSTRNVPELLGLATFMDAIVMSYEVRSVKPGAMIYIKACTLLGVEPKDCLFVGDGNDGEIDGALQLGMTTIMVDRHHENTGWYPQPTAKADYRVEQVGEVLDIVKQLNKLQ